MINGLGVLGWGVGGIEAEAVMLGQPLYMLAPEVIGFELSGQLPPGATATDLVLTRHANPPQRGGGRTSSSNFSGRRWHGMKVADRALVANMAPEYGATMGFFPIDEQTLAYLRETGRIRRRSRIWSSVTRRSSSCSARRQRRPGADAGVQQDAAAWTSATIEPSVAGPKRPQDRVPLAAGEGVVSPGVDRPGEPARFRPRRGRRGANGGVPGRGRTRAIGHGAVVIAAITSCTNTSNPDVMLAAGLLAKKAVERGLTVPPYVKTSLAPGSRVVTDYLRTRPGWTSRWTSWASTPSATAARRASATAGRCPSRWPRPSARGTSWPRRS